MSNDLASVSLCSKQANPTSLSVGLPVEADWVCMIVQG